MYFLTNKIVFPPVSEALEDGLLAIGGDLSISRLELAYNSGIFPWFSEEDPIIWYAPPQRMVLFPHRLKVTKSMKKIIDRGQFTVTKNNAFKDVITNCATIQRKDQDGTWITSEMITAYLELHEKGLADSIEVWENNSLVGGLYGINLKHKKIFCGESMFSKVSNASKVAFISLVDQLSSENYKLIDCQLYTKHLASLGAEEIPRSVFMEYLNEDR